MESFSSVNLINFTHNSNGSAYYPYFLLLQILLFEFHLIRMFMLNIEIEDIYGDNKKK